MVMNVLIEKGTDYIACELAHVGAAFGNGKARKMTFLGALAPDFLLDRSLFDCIARVCDKR